MAEQPTFGECHKIWANEIAVIRIMAQLPHRDVLRLESVSSAFERALQRSFLADERVSLDFDTIIGRDSFTFQIFQSIWNRYKEFDLDRPSKITSLTVPCRVQAVPDQILLTNGKRRRVIFTDECPTNNENSERIAVDRGDNLILLTLGACYGPRSASSLDNRQLFNLRELRLARTIDTFNDLEIFKRMLRNLPLLQILEFGLPGVINAKHSEMELYSSSYNGLEDVFEPDLYLSQLRELHLRPSSKRKSSRGYPLLTGRSFPAWTPNLKVLNSIGMKKSNSSSIDPQIGKSPFDLIADCPIEEFRVMTIEGNEYYRSSVKDWIGRDSKMSATLRILHLNGYTFQLEEATAVLSRFEHLIELQCVLVESDGPQNIASCRKEPWAQLKRLEFSDGVEEEIIEFVSLHCVNLERLNLAPSWSDGEVLHERMIRLLAGPKRRQTLEVSINEETISALSGEFSNLGGDIAVFPYEPLFSWTRWTSWSSAACS